MSKSTRNGLAGQRHAREAPLNGRHGLPAEILDRVPPSDTRAERGLLAALLIDGTLAGDVFAVLDDPDAFHGPDYRRVFEAMLELHKTGQPIDTILVLNHLLANGALGDQGVAATLREIAEAEATAANANFYAKIVAEKFQMRRLREAGQRLIQIAEDGDRQGADATVKEAQEVFAAAVRGSGRRSKFAPLSCADLAGLEFQPKWRIRGLLTAGEPLLIAGPKKTLKTSIVLDLALSLAIGGEFLGQFPIERVCRVLLFSGESGMPTLAETARRIAEAKAIPLAEIDGLRIVGRVPVFGNKRDADDLRQAIEAHAAEFVIIDPAYLAMSGENAGNLFSQGAALRDIAEICNDAGAQLGLVHHARKGIADPYQPAELDDIAWAGFQEWTRQWLLVARREKYEPGTGSHRLWLTAGGSAGHSSNWAIDVEEGVNEGDGGRHWNLDLMPGAEAKQAADARKRQAKQIAKETDEKTAIEKAMRKLVDAAAKFPAGETRKTLKDLAGVSGRVAAAAFAQLLADGAFEDCKVQRTNRQTPYPGVKICTEK